ncbi:lipoprotein N-acyltransferase Lnb [Phocaeicola coprocola]
MSRLKYFIFCLFMGVAFSVQSQSTDSIRFSLLTCAPGTEIYSLFGHTAIRYENYTRRIDVVFNYGMFSFNTPNFIFRFVAGETDYQLGITPYSYFEAEYAMRGSSVYQQVLNLTQSEKERLLTILENNYLPENRIYRYNYFYDNCTTRARDKIEECIEGKVVYPDSLSGKSYRSIVHEFTAGSPWDEFGIDLCLGAEADKEINKRQQMFSPFYMKYYASNAYIVDAGGTRRPLILDETKIVDVEPEEVQPGFILSPLMCGALFLALCVVMAWGQWKTQRIWWGWDVVLYGLQGLAGCIIAFLFFFSVHPTVGSNWLLILFNPIPLLYLPFMVYKAVKRKKDYYHVGNMVYLTLFITILPFCGQEFNLTVLPLALGLLVTSASHVLVWNKK